MDIAYLLKYLWRRKWFILGLSALSAILAFSFTALQKNKYSSTAQYSTGVAAQKISLSGGYGGGYTEIETNINNVIATFRSPIVLGMISYKLMLNEIDKYKDSYNKNSAGNEKKELNAFLFDPGTAQLLREKLNKGVLLNPAIPEEQKLLQVIDQFGYGFQALDGGLQINRIPNTDYIDVIYRSQDPIMAATVVNSVGLEYVRFYESLSSQRGKQTADTIASFLQAQQNKVDSLTNLLIAEKQRQGAINPEELSSSALQTVTSLQSRLNEEKARYNTASATYESLRKQLDILSNSYSSVSENNAEVITLQEKKRDLISQLTAKGGNDVELKKQIDDLNRQILAKSGASSGNAAKKKDQIDNINMQLAEQQGIINASAKTIADLEGQIRVASGKTNIGAGSEIKLSALQSSLEMENRQLTQIKEKYIQAQGLLKEVPTTNFRQTLVGQPATQKDADKRMIVMGIAGFSMLLLSSLFLALGQILNNSIKTPSQFSRMVDLPLLAVTNQVSMKNSDPNSIISTAEPEDQASAYFRESLRKLRYDIESNGKKKILVTSLKPGTGKTTLIVSLAKTFTLSKKKILLVDTNFSDNSLSGLYPSQVYLEDSARYSRFGADEIKKFITRTNDPYIDIICCKGGNYTPSEILPQQNLLGHLDAVANEYDYIILEGAALKTHSDSRELSHYADTVIAVFSAEESLGQQDYLMIKYLESLKGRFMGAVLNRVELENADA